MTSCVPSGTSKGISSLIPKIWKSEGSRKLSLSLDLNQSVWLLGKRLVSVCVDTHGGRGGYWIHGDTGLLQMLCLWGREGKTFDIGWPLLWTDSKISAAGMRRWKCWPRLSGRGIQRSEVSSGWMASGGLLCGGWLICSCLTSSTCLPMGHLVVEKSRERALCLSA